MDELHIVGVDLAKRTFVVHGADKSGYVLLRKKLTRIQFAKFLTELPKCILAMEACASAHHWGREAQALGLTVLLVPAVYVKPFARRQKNDAVDAQAIVEAALRPTMSFVAVKTKEQQAQAVVFRSRDLLVRQRTQLINASCRRHAFGVTRGHLAEFGVLLPEQRASIERIVTACRDLDADGLPTPVVEMVATYADQIDALAGKIAEIDAQIRQGALVTKEVRRLQTMPGVGPITAMAIRAFCPDAQHFENGRAFASWLGLVPRQHSTGGQARLGRITKMGQADVRRLLITGAMSVISASERKGRRYDPWLATMLARRPRIVVATALANRMARRLWAMLARERDYEVRAAA